MMTVANTTFALDVWQIMPSLNRYALRLWSGDSSGAEDGMQETVCRAIAQRDKFKGGNLAAWLTHMLLNIRRDELSKGYRKGQGEPGGRLVFCASYEDYPTPDLCDPESILIARELAAQRASSRTT